MSTSNYIVCRTCKERLWIGQGSYIYSGDPESMQRLQDFLFRHQTFDSARHELLFVDEHWEGQYDPGWTRVDDL